MTAAACTSTCPPRARARAEHILSTYRPDQKFTHEEARLLDLCPAGPCRPRRRQLLHLHLPGTFFLRYRHLRGHLGSHRCAERPPSTAGAKPEGHAPAGRHSGPMWSIPIRNDELREYLRKIMRKQAGGWQRPDLWHRPRGLHPQRSPCPDPEGARPAIWPTTRALPRNTRRCAALNGLAPQVFAEEHRGPKIRSAPTWICSVA